MNKINIIDIKNILSLATKTIIFYTESLYIAIVEEYLNFEISY